MERGKEKVQDKEMGKVLDHIYQNALGNPVTFTETPSAAEMKANTIGKVKDATDYVYVKFSDGKCIRIPVTEVT